MKKNFNCVSAIFNLKCKCHNRHCLDSNCYRFINIFNACQFRIKYQRIYKNRRFLHRSIYTDKCLKAIYRLQQIFDGDQLLRGLADDLKLYIYIDQQSHYQYLVYQQKPINIFIRLNGRKFYYTKFLKINIFIFIQTQGLAKPMRKSFIPLCLVLLIVLNTNAIDITWISTVADSSTSSMSGSLMGGTQIHIKATGLSPDPSQIKVLLQNSANTISYPCKVPADGLVPGALTCITAPSFYPVSGLTVYVYSTDDNGFTSLAYLSDTKYTYSYLDSYTPMVYDIYPAVAIGNTMLNYYGIHRITKLGDGLRDTGDIIEMNIGDEICNVFDIGQADINPNAPSIINCKSSYLKKAGKYAVSEYLTPGNSAAYFKLRRTSFLDENYNFVVLPNITSISPNSGAVGGQILTIKGSGFSVSPSQNVVMVDQTQCVPQTSSGSEITCILNPKLSGQNSSLPSNTTGAQINPYQSGSGFFYTRYSISSLSPQSALGLKQAVDAGQSLQILQQGIKGQIKTGNIYNDYYGQVFKGYFTAPVDGDYVFRGVADNQFRIYMSKDYGTTSQPPTLNLTNLIAYSNTNQNVNQIYFTDVATAQSALITLEAGKKYYLEVYHINLSGDGGLSVSAQVPNTDASLSWQTHATQIVQSDLTNDPQVIRYNLTGVTSGTILLQRIQTNSTYDIIYQKNVTINYNATAAQFCSALNQFYFYSGYGLTCALQMYDSTGAVTSDYLNANKFSWTVTIQKYRTPAVVAIKFNTNYYNGATTTLLTTPQKLNDHSPLLGGTFTATIGGYPIKIGSSLNIPFDVSASTIQQALSQIKEVDFTKTLVYRKGTPSLGATWIISYIGVNQLVPQIIFDGTNLVGGKIGTFPTINCTTRRNYSSNLLFDPIDYQFMSTYSPNPNLMLDINGIKSVCLHDCSYTFVTTVPQISDATLSANILSLALTDPNSVNASLADIHVQFDGVECTNLVGQMISFTCDLPLNTDGSPMLIAGDYYPIIYINSIGFIQPMANVTKITVVITITTVYPSTINNNGGNIITIQGSGFSTNVLDSTVVIDGVNTQILSATNTEITVVSPTTDTTTTTTVQINSRTKDASNAIAFTAPSTYAQIFSINPTSASPVLKAVMIITGSGFGVDPTKAQVFLSNSSGNIYGMRVLQINDTSIKCGIPGGLPGNFKVIVAIDGLGNAIPNPTTANDFIYEVVITGVTPATGSSYGGTLLTISGRNFVADSSQSLVFIGNELNQFCYIQTISTSSITCRTIYNSYYPINVSQVITLTSRLIIDNTCEGVCQFSYFDESLSPNLISMTPTAIQTGNVILTGQRFDLGSSCMVSLLNNATGLTTVLTPNSCNQTTINFTIPSSLEGGFYYVKSRNDPIGESNPIMLQVNSYIGNAISSTISVNGGQATFTGTGLPAIWPNARFKLTLISNNKFLPINVVSCSATSFVLSIPPAVSGTSYSFNLISPTMISYTKSFSQQTTSTPTVSLTSPTTGSSGSNSISLNRTSLQSTTPQKIQIFAINNPNYVIDVVINTWTYSGTLINFSATLNSGKYGFKLYDSILGWYTVTGNINIPNSGSYSVSNVQASFSGGSFTVTGVNISQAATITVQGRKGIYLSGSSSQAMFKIPPLITPMSQTNFNLVNPQKLDLNKYVRWGDTKNWEYSFDNIEYTNYESNNSQCAIGIDIGAALGLSITRIRFFPNVAWNIASNYLKDAQFQVSNDNSTWTNISNIDSMVHAGWNIIIPSDQTPYRYIRFNHNSTSKCMLAQFQLSGIVMNMITLANTVSHTSDVIFNDGLFTQTWSGAVQYRQDNTPIITAISPRTGNVFGNYVLTLTGIHLNISTPTVSIDGQQCVLISSNQTDIQCTVASRLTIPSQNSFSVNIGNTPSILRDKFRYVMRWSDIRTWGTDLPPIDDDLIYVPEGMHLLVDQSTPILNGIIVQGGTLQFADQADMVIRAGLITLIGGQFIAGTQEIPYQNKLTFVMYGNYYGLQQPMFGNKGIGCMNCKFSMYGQKRTPTWTELQMTVNPNQNQLTVTDTIDWQAGEQIVIASTSYDHNEAERFTINSVSGKTITIDGKFKYQHYADIQNYGTDSITMRAQVGLLTRNIKMMGDQTSVPTNYGSHLMLTGSAENGFIGHIAYTEFTNCGQPQIVGRYCMHFHMAGDVSQSYAIGNAVHDSMARVITLHGVHFLHVAWNVGYRVKGHNFFVEDGIQTNNLIEHNLAIGSLSVFNMMQTDVSVASFWITNPYNHLRYNHAAGSDFYGIWYEIKPHPDGPSATLDICPIGNMLGQVHDNVAHSNVRFGLRIKQLESRQNPCLPIRNDGLDDPWSQNPSIQSKFSNFTLYKNKQAGLLAQQTGHTIFQNFTIAESLLAGMQFYRNNQTKQYVRVINSVIIGMSTGNGPVSVSDLTGSKGAIGPRSGVISMQNVSFYQFPSGMTVFQSCSKCNEVKLYTNTAQQYFFKGIKYSNINGPYLFMKGLKRQIIYDLDGSFSSNFDSNSRISATIVWNWKHIAAQTAACKAAQTPSLWDNALTCDDTITIRKVVFTNLLNFDQFKSIPLKAQLIASVDEEVNINTTTSNSQVYSLQQNMEPKIQKEFSFALPYATNRTYNIWWKSGIDFTHLSMQNSQLFTASNDGILFKFKYTQNRELFQIAPLKNILSANSANPVIYNPKSADHLDATTCTNGQYYHNNDVNVSMMVLCSSGKAKANLFQYVDVNGIKCRYLCPKPAGEFVKQNFLRYWSDATQWPNARMPLDGQNVTVNGNWTIIMDVDPAFAPLLTIDGDVLLFDDRNINITAGSIWIRAGSIVAGSDAQPFKHKITIQINGQKQDRGIVIDPMQAGNKLFAVTGTLRLIGNPPATTWTKLSAYANVGATSISVLSASGWAIGDQITLSSSFSNTTQHEKVKITGISSNTVITFTPALKYDHYGASSATINNAFGQLDTRAGVGHLTRNIQIVSGPNYTWGYRVLVYGYKDTSGFIRTGDVVLKGVQFTMGGQFDTEKSTLDINNIRAGATQSTITKSSFHQCKSFCMNIDNVALFDIANNVFYDAKLFHVRALNLFSFSFSNNLMTAVSKRVDVPFDQLVACFASYEQFDVTTQNVSVSSNLCQGSTGIGFAIVFVQCSLIDSYPFIDNTVGSTNIGYIINKISSTCVAAKGLKAYATTIGQLCNPNAADLRLANMIMADNGRAITIRNGGTSDNKVAYLKSSYITAVSRPSCSNCYGTGKIDCSGNHAVRMMAIGSNTQSLPDKFSPGFDVICKQQSFDGRAFLYDNVFDSYRQSYSTLPQCSNNVVFKPHSGSVDITGSHHLWNTTCTNCDTNSYGYFPPPLKSQLGWFGGCGTILCTGMNNYFLQDHTGDFFTFKGILLANNSWVGNASQNCTLNTIMNGYMCQRQDFAVLQYESLAPDFNTRIMWPVYLKYDGGNWVSQTNGWKQWHWQGGQPLNNRIGRFVSIIQLQKWYNVTMAAMPPIDMRYRIQRRLPEGNASDWVVIKMFYPMPNSIAVSVQGQTIKPISLLDNNGQNSIDTTVCGSNKFFYQNYTIHFVVTGDANCQVRIRLTNSIQLTSRFSMNIDDFFTAGGPTLLIDRIGALLHINDTSRLKIVGIYAGSVTAVVFIDPQVNSSVDGSALTPAQQVASIQATQALLNQAIANGSFSSSISSGGDLGSLLSVSSTLHYVDPSSTTSGNNDQTGLIIGIVLGVTIAISLVVVGSICYMRKRAKISQLSSQLPMDSDGQKGNANDNKVVSDENFSVVSFDIKNQKELN